MGPNTLYAVHPGKALQPIGDRNSMHLLRGYRGGGVGKSR